MDEGYALVSRSLMMGTRTRIWGLDTAGARLDGIRRIRANHGDGWILCVGRWWEVRRRDGSLGPLVFIYSGRWDRTWRGCLRVIKL